jgi:hypothetical protein
VALCSSVGNVASPLATPAQALMINTEAMSHFLFGLKICDNFTIASRLLKGIPGIYKQCLSDVGDNEVLT